MITDTKNVGQLILPDSLTPYSGYQFWLPCNDIAADDVIVADYSGNAANFDEHSGSTDLGANPGSMTTAAADSGGIVNSAGDFIWDLSAGQSLLISFWIKAAGPVTGNRSMLANAIDITVTGVRLITQTGEKLRWYVFCDSAQHDPGGENGTVVIDGTWHHCVAALDSATKLFYQYLDGVFDVSWDTAIGAGETNANPDDFEIGSAGSMDPQGYEWKDIHAIVFPGALPSTISQIVKKLYSSPYYPIVADDVS